MKKLLVVPFLLVASLWFSHIPPVKALPFVVPVAASFVMNRMIAGVLMHALVTRGLAENAPEIGRTLTRISEHLSSLAQSARAASLIGGHSPLWIGMLSLMGLPGLTLAAKAGEREFKASIYKKADGFLFWETDGLEYPYTVSDSREFGEYGWAPRYLKSQGLTVFRSKSTPAELSPFLQQPDGDSSLGRMVRSYDDGIAVANTPEQAAHMLYAMCATYEAKLPRKVEMYAPRDGGGLSRYGFFCAYEDDDILPPKDGPHVRIEHTEEFLGSDFPYQEMMARHDRGIEEDPVAPSLQAAILDEESLAQVTNIVWQSTTASPDFDGVPFAPATPVRPAEVKDWQRRNPAHRPAMSDLFERVRYDPNRDVPIQVGPGRTIDGAREGQEAITGPVGGVIDRPITRPGEGARDVTREGSRSRTGEGAISPPAEGTNPIVETIVIGDVNVINEPTVRIDPGSVPEAVAPTLEEPPTAAKILQPVLRMLPGLKSWAVPAHGGACQRPVFNVFKQSIRMDAMCDIADAHRSVIHACMLVVFAIAALRIVLSA